MKPQMDANIHEFSMSYTTLAANPEGVRFGFHNSFISDILLAFIRVH